VSRNGGTRRFNQISVISISWKGREGGEKKGREREEGRVGQGREGGRREGKPRFRKQIAASGIIACQL